jgi:6-phosphogluconolactonase (cycloisomerase 2 family)
MKIKEIIKEILVILVCLMLVFISATFTTADNSYSPMDEPEKIIGNLIFNDSFEYYSTNPETLPTSTGYGASFSSDDTYLAVAHSTTPFITIYKRDNDTFTKLDDPANLPASTGYDVSWSSDGTYLAVAHSTTPFITIYKRDNDTFTKLDDPADLPAGTGNGVSWSSDDTYLAVAHASFPYITIYKRDNDTFTKISAVLLNLPTSTGYGASFSSDDTYLAVAHALTPFITIYKRDNDTFTKLDDPANLPASTGRGVSWSSDGTYLAVAHSTTPFITIYKRDNDTFTKLDDPADLPAGTGYSVSWSSDDTYLAVAHSAGTAIAIYKRDTDTFTKLSYPKHIPSGIGYGVSWSSDDAYLTIIHQNYPYLTIYEHANGNFKFITENFGIWERERVTGEFTFNRLDNLQSGTNPICYPYDGLRFIRYRCYGINSGYQARLYNLENFSVDLHLKFMMYHDTGYTEETDKMEIQISEDMNNWSTIGEPFYRSCSLQGLGSEGWYEHTINITGYENPVYIGFLVTSDYGNNIFFDDLKIYELMNKPYTELKITPDTLYVKKGETFTVGIYVTPEEGEYIGSISTDLIEFSKETITCNNVTKGNIFADYEGFEMYSNGTINNSNGTIQFIYWSKNGTNCSEPGYFVNLSFTANEAGTGYINITQHETTWYNQTLEWNEDRPSIVTFNGTIYIHFYQPDHPTNLTAVLINETSIELEWAKGLYADNTIIEFSESSTPWGRGEKAEIYNDTGTYYLHEGLSMGKTYYYQAWSYNISDDEYSLTFASAHNSTGDNTPPAQPTNEVPANNAPYESVYNTYLNVSVYDEDADELTVYFYWGNGTAIGFKVVNSGEVASLFLPDYWSREVLGYNVTWLEHKNHRPHGYSWYVIADDGYNQTQSPTWYFNTSIAWDVNEDKRVDITDVSAVVTYFGDHTGKPGEYPADINNDARVDITDISAVVTYFGMTY